MAQSCYYYARSAQIARGACASGRPRVQLHLHDINSLGVRVFISTIARTQTVLLLVVTALQLASAEQGAQFQFNQTVNAPCTHQPLRAPAAAAASLEGRTDTVSGTYIETYVHARAAITPAVDGSV